MSGDLTAVISVTNHLNFFKRPWVNLLELKRGFLHQKVATRPEIQSELVKTTSNQNHPKNIMLCSVRESDSCYIDNQPYYFHLMTVSKLIRAQKWVPASQSNPWPQIQPALAKTTTSHNCLQNSTFCYVRGSDSCYIDNRPFYYY